LEKFKKNCLKHNYNKINKISDIKTDEPNRYSTVCTSFIKDIIFEMNEFSGSIKGGEFVE